MKKINTVNTQQDVRGLIFMAEYVNTKHFPLVSVLGKSDFEDIETIINNNHSPDIKESTIRRICTFRTSPTRLSYKMLDIFTQWCFEGDGDYDSFKEYLKERNDEINHVSTSDDEVEDILNILNEKKTPVSISHKVNVDLGNIPVSFNLGEGFVAKLIEEVSIVTGDLLTKKFKKNPERFGIYSNKRIETRIRMREERWQLNIENIVSKSIEFARKKEASNNPVDPDWIVEFFNIAQDCSDEKMQYLWAKILAGEIESPESFSKRTLNTLRSISKEEAELFSLLSNCLWTLDGKNVSSTKILIKESDIHNEYTDFYWGFDRRDLYLLEDIGLIEETIYSLDSRLGYNLIFFNIKHSIKHSKERTEFDVIRLTKVGEEIYSIVQKSINKEYYKHVKDYLKKNKIVD
tara:strand:+ start:5204 stop:6418 length:1215 start_codon:yes stop_codon:yes gene_type:complete